MRMNTPQTFETMTDKQLARHEEVSLHAAILSALLTLGCAVAGVWVDLRWLATAPIVAFVCVFCLYSAALAKAERVDRGDQ